MYMCMCMCMCPKISRRSAPGTHQKQSKRPTFSPGRDPGDSPPVTSQISPHIFNVSTALFCSLAVKPRAGRTSLTDVIKSKVKRHGRHGV